MSFLSSTLWWRDVQVSHEEPHNSLVKHIERGSLRFLFYQKKDSFIRLQVVAEHILWEGFLSWDRWMFFLRQLEDIKIKFATLEEKQHEGFSMFCDVFHLPINRFSFSWAQVFSHGYLPLWFFPTQKKGVLWEFCLPVAEMKKVSSLSDRLIIFDEKISWQKEEKKILFSFSKEIDMVDMDFLSSIVWQKRYADIHVIAHGKDGVLLSKEKKLHTFPVKAEKMVFFHCCEMLSHSQSLVSHALADGCFSVIAPLDTILDDGKVLTAIAFFYEIMQKTNPRYAFHFTGLVFDEFKTSFALALPYTRLYG